MNDQDDHASELASLMRRCIDKFSVDPRKKPDQTTAIIADLVGRRDLWIADDIRVLRRVLVLAADDRGPRDRSAIIASLEGHQALGQAERILDSIYHELGLGLEDPQNANARGGRPIARTILVTAVISGILVAMAVLIFFNLSRFGWEIEPHLSPTASPSASPQRAPDGYHADFNAIAQNNLLITRGWRVTPGGREFIGVVNLQNETDKTQRVSHREIPPPKALSVGADIQWTPTPAKRVNTVAVFDLEIPAGQTVSIEYRGPLPADLPLSESSILDWFDDWREASARVSSPLGAYAEELEPVVEPGGAVTR